MSIDETKCDAQFKVECLMGMFDFLGDKLKEIHKRGETIKEREMLLIGLLCAIRDKLRAKGDFESADKIRDRLQGIGVKIEDQKIQSSPV